MKKLLAALLLCAAALCHAQQAGPAKYALVIGNSSYTGISTLRNPVNDANDMEAALKGLGFTVEKVLNGSLEQMENAVLGFSRRLGLSRNTYGFFFYAGHGVQSAGENYLIPVAAENIRSEPQLRERAVSLQFIMESMSVAGNELNMVVLDACRDNPFAWSSRSGSGGRGLSVVARAPTGSIVMYATGANSTANDGTGRNGLFTSHLLTNIKTPGLSVFEVFDRTMGDVINATNGGQHPELSLRFPGATSAYLGLRPAPAMPPAIAPPPAAQAPPPAAAVQPTPAAAAVGPVLPPAPLVPPVPRNPRAGTPAADSVTLSWDNAGSGISYKVYYSTKNTLSGVDVFGEPTDATSMDISGLKDKTNYYFWVSSLQGEAESGRSSMVSIRTPAFTKPAPSPQPLKPPREKGTDTKDARFHSIGAAVGTSFSAPWFVGTLHGTFAPTKYSFMEAGMDFGLVSGVADTTYFSLYPFAHYALFVPFASKGGWYAGLGPGFMHSTYSYRDEKGSDNVFAMDVVTGFVIGDFFNISYTLRTNFNSANNKLSVGYVKRFR